MGITGASLFSELDYIELEKEINRILATQDVNFASVDVLYVVSPIDLIPDMIPLVGFSDDVMAVALCKNMIRKDLEKYNHWRKEHLAEA